MAMDTKTILGVGMLSLWLALTAASSAQPKAKKVGSVIDINGERLMSSRKRDGRWFQGHVGMKNFLAERLRTDESTLAVLRFDLGGVAGIGKATEVEITGARSIETLGNWLSVKNGLFWAKVDKQNTNLQIKSAGGVIGIEGTEFLLACEEETGITEVLLFEGQVKVTDDKGTSKTMFPGDYALYGGGADLCVLSYPPSALRTLVVERFPRFSSFLASRGVTQIPNPASPTLVRGYLAPTESLANNLKASQAGLLNGRQVDPSVPSVSGLLPYESTIEGRPTFQWTPVQGASSYEIVVSTDPNMDEIVFSGSSPTSRLEIPEGARGLAAGRYFYRVLATDKTNALIGRAAQSWFDTSGWSSPGISLDDEASKP